MAALITFNAADIHLEGSDVDLELPAAWFVQSLGDTEVTPTTQAGSIGTLRGRISRSGNNIVVRARVRTRVEVPCVRCLDPATVEVNAELSLLLEPKRPKRESRRGRRSERKSSTTDEYEFSASEADTDVYDGETVVLDDFIREIVLLEVPHFPLCTEGCPGIRDAPAMIELADTPPVDPRLAPLGAFRETDGPTTIEDLIAAANERGARMGKKPVLRSNHSSSTQTPKKKKRK